MLSPKLQATKEILKRQRAEYAARPVKGNREIIDGVNCIIHFPESDKKDLPLLFELHGGAWVAGDAALVDSLCETVSLNTPCASVNINYTKLDEQPFPYPMEEALKVIEYFKNNARKYGVNPDRFVLCGQSAGAHIAAGAAILAKEKGIKLAGQILVYPFLDCTGTLPNTIAENEKDKSALKEIHNMLFGSLDVSAPYLSPAVAPDKELEGIADTDIIVCGIDPLREHGTTYYEKLKSAGIPVRLKDYPDALHGFLEVNREDFDNDNEAKNDRQAVFARDCEQCIIDIMRNV